MTKRKKPPEPEPASSSSTEEELPADYWEQWQQTSEHDLARDTYGTQRRRDLQERYR